MAKRLATPRSGVDRAAAPRLPGDPVHHRRAQRAHQRGDPLRRDRRPAGPGRHPASRGPRAAPGIVPGIKVDGGTRPLAGFPGEVATQGLDGLRERLEEYAALGVRFAKWRAVIRDRRRTTDGRLRRGQRPRARPLRRALPGGRADADRRARGADGRAARPARRCADVTERVLREVYAQLARQRVVLEATLLKPNMVLPGSDCLDRSTTQTIAAPRSRCCGARCRPPCPASCSCPGDRPTSRPPRGSTRSTGSGPSRGSSASPSGARCKRRCCGPGPARTRTEPPSGVWSIARHSTVQQGTAATGRRWETERA